jgi:hypothetical protein
LGDVFIVVFVPQGGGPGAGEEFSFLRCQSGAAVDEGFDVAGLGPYCS